MKKSKLKKIMKKLSSVENELAELKKSQRESQKGVTHLIVEAHKDIKRLKTK